MSGLHHRLRGGIKPIEWSLVGTRTGITNIWVPADAEAGDIGIMACSGSSSPSGWSIIQSSNNLNLFYKILESSDADTSISLSSNDANVLAVIRPITLSPVTTPSISANFLYYDYLTKEISSTARTINTGNSPYLAIGSFIGKQIDPNGNWRLDPAISSVSSGSIAIDSIVTNPEYEEFYWAFLIVWPFDSGDIPTSESFNYYAGPYENENDIYAKAIDATLSF